MTTIQRHLTVDFRNDMKPNWRMNSLCNSRDQGSKLIILSVGEEILWGWVCCLRNYKVSLQLHKVKKDRPETLIKPSEARRVAKCSVSIYSCSATGRRIPIKLHVYVSTHTAQYSSNYQSPRFSPFHHCSCLSLELSFVPPWSLILRKQQTKTVKTT